MKLILLAVFVLLAMTLFIAHIKTEAFMACANGDKSACEAIRQAGDSR